MFLHVHTQLQLSPYREHLLCSLLVSPGPQVTLHLETLPAHPRLTWSLLTYRHKYANTHIQRFIGYHKDLKHKTLPVGDKISKSLPLITNSTNRSVLLYVIMLQKGTVILFFPNTTLEQFMNLVFHASDFFMQDINIKCFFHYLSLTITLVLCTQCLSFVIGLKQFTVLFVHLYFYCAITKPIAHTKINIWS